MPEVLIVCLILFNLIDSTLYSLHHPGGGLLTADKTSLVIVLRCLHQGAALQPGMSHPPPSELLP